MSVSEQSITPDIAPVPPTLVGCDDGFAQIKIAFLDADGALVQQAIPSRAAIGSQVTTQTEGGRTSDSYITDGAVYTVNPHLPSQDTRFASYPTSDLNRVLVHHALRRAGLGNTRVRLATGLPPGSYYRGDGAINERLIDGKRKNLVTRLEASDHSPLATILSHCVLTEAACGMLDYLVELDGSYRELDEPIVIVDIGGRTTDVLTILPPGTVIDHAQSGTTRTGVLKVQDILHRRLCDHYDLETLNPRTIEKALRSRSITLYGDQDDVGPIVDGAIEEVSKEILQYVQSRLSGVAEVERVLFIGGGAQVMRSVIEQFPQAYIPEAPEFANARGMLKNLILQHGAPSQ